MVDDSKIVQHKKYGQHILVEDSTGNRYSTKNIVPLGCRTLFDGNIIHSKTTTPDIKLDYEL